MWKWSWVSAIALVLGVSGAVAQPAMDEGGAEAALDAATDAAEAEQAEQRGATYSFFFENDGTFVKPNHNTDRHYTSGQGLSVAWQLSEDDPIQDALGFSSESSAMGLVLGQQIFTSDPITDPTPGQDARPYAGYLFGGVFYQRQARDAWGIDVLDHVQLDLGVVGPSSLGEEVQSSVHEISGDEDPLGWDTQLEDEVAVQLGLRRQWRHDLGDWDTGVMGDPLVLQVLPEVGLDVGTVHRRVNAGTTLRLGANLPDDFGPTSLTRLGSATGAPVNGLSQYVFVRAVGRYVEWNTFLDGSNYKDPSRSVSSEPWVGELSGGAAVEWRYNNTTIKFTYQQTFMTREFETQGADDAYGGIALTVGCVF